MTPDDSARGTVEEIRRRWSDNSGPKSAWTDIWDLLQAYDTLEAQRDEAHVGHTLVSNTFKDLVPMVTYHSTTQNMLTCVRDALAQACRERDERTEEVGRYMMANNRLAEELAQARREAEAAQDRDNAAFADFTALVGGNTWGTAYHRIREMKADRDRLAEALRNLLGELSDVQIAAVREGCGNTNTAVLLLRVSEARALLTPPSPAKETTKDPNHA